MKIKLLLISSDNAYSERLSNVLSEKYSDLFDVNVCSSKERLINSDLIFKHDMVFIDSDFLSDLDLGSIKLPIILTTDNETEDNIVNAKYRIYKYQRISHIVREALEIYAESGSVKNSHNKERAKIIAVWSPCGGVGKTTVSLAYATSKACREMDVVYFNLENFSSIPTYFMEQGKSISSVFSKLDGNVNMLLKGIMLKDGASGINYFSTPNNYDDINILSPDDIEIIINSCCTDFDELIIDLSSNCNKNVEKVFEMADYVFMVSDGTRTSKNKIQQFLTQHNVAANIESKLIMISNKGSKVDNINISNVINLPLIQTQDPIAAYKSLACSQFEW